MLDSKDEALALLSSQREKIVRNFGVKRIALFGSVVRNSMNKNSDIDVLVNFAEPTFDHYFDLKFYLEDMFKQKIDLVCRDSLRPRIRPFIEEEAVDAWSMD